MRRLSLARERGVATLAVVMVLLFVVALAAAYLGRSLIFEQRTSANYYRSVQAFETAEAALEWATALLNSGRIDSTCAASNDNTLTSFRQRYLNIDPNTGNIDVRRWDDSGVMRNLTPQCVRGAAGWTCHCPDTTAPNLPAPVGAGVFPAFRVSFEPVAQPGAVRVNAVACTSLSNACLRDGVGSQGDAAMRASVVVALAPALAVPPVAALTVRGDIDTGAATLRLHNTDAASNGITVQAGGAVSVTGASLLSAVGEEASRSVIANDASLAGLNADRMFTAVFGTSRDAYRTQAAAIRVDCGGGCADRLRTLADNNPGRVLWINDDLLIESDVQLGTPDSPVVIVASGNARILTAGTRIYGALYSAAADWANDGAAALVQGAAIAEGRFIGTGNPVLHFDPQIVANLRRSSGSFVRVPGSWRDF